MEVFKRIHLSDPLREKMNTNNSAERILNTLATAAKELQLLADPKLVTAREWLSYNDALGKVKDAIAALKKLNPTDSPAENLTQTQAQPKKSLMAKLKEIKIDGEPDWSQRCNGEIL